MLNFKPGDRVFSTFDGIHGIYISKYPFASYKESCLIIRLDGAGWGMGERIHFNVNVRDQRIIMNRALAFAGFNSLWWVYKKDLIKELT